MLVGFNQNLLLRMQEATPTTLGLCGLLAALLAYGWHVRVTAESAHPRLWAGPNLWATFGGVALALSVLTQGSTTLIAMPIVLLHQYYLRATWPLSSPQVQPWWTTWRNNPGLIGGLLALAITVVITLPWFILMVQAHSWQAITALGVPPAGLLSRDRLSLLPRLIELAPATLPLGVYGTVRAIRSALVDETNTRETVGGSLWVIWLAVAALTPTIWPNAPLRELELVLLIPLSLLAAQTIADLVNRRLPVRALIGLAPVTAVSVAWWASAELHKAVDDLIHGQASATTALGLHLALDLIIAAVFITRVLNHWAHGRDDRQHGY